MTTPGTRLQKLATRGEAWSFRNVDHDSVESTALRCRVPHSRLLIKSSAVIILVGRDYLIVISDLGRASHLFGWSDCVVGELSFANFKVQQWDRPNRLTFVLSSSFSRKRNRMAISLKKFMRSLNLPSRTGSSGFDQRSFNSFEVALRETSSAGYETHDLVRVVVAKTQLLRDQLSRTRFVDLATAQSLLGLLARDRGPTFRVLDFGGGAGIHYFQSLAFLGSGIDIQWNVVETPEMVDAASAQLGNEHLKFFTSVEAAVGDLEKVELVFSNSSLPYTPDPFLYLEKLLAVQADHLYITRTPLGDDLDSKIYLQQSKLSQNGPGFLPTDFEDGDVYYPITIVNRQTFEQKMKNQYSVRFWTKEDSSSFLRGVGVTQNYSYFLDLINLNLGVQ